MRTLCLGAAIATWSALSGQAAAQGAWCSQDMNAVNCGYYTLQQCQAGVSGNGGYCIPSPYVRQVTPEPPRQRRGKRAR
jgi:hypothetical protein